MAVDIQTEDIYTDAAEGSGKATNLGKSLTAAGGSTTPLTDGMSYTTSTFKAISDNISGFFGMPYQFSNIVDPCIEDNTDGSIQSTNIGRKFNEKIFSVAPILFLTPGKPEFLAGASDDTKQQIVNKLADVLGGDEDNEVLSTDADARYYSFASDFEEFTKYANISLRALAIYLGISEVEIPVPGKSTNVKLKDIDVYEFMNETFRGFFGNDYVVPFFLDATSSITETFSNNTTESTLASTANGFSTSAREIEFLLGGESKDAFGNLSQALVDAGTNFSQAITEVLGGIAGDNSVIGRLTSELTTITSGGKIVFPEIWSDSEYDKSFDISIKLRSPDPDPVSIFLNIYLPLVLLISMASPKQRGNSANAYISPFLVRATYRSMFNCDLGIIRSLSIDRGGESRWNILGMPTSVEVSLSIQDLYSSMFISKGAGMVSNTAQMDYLSTLAGLDLHLSETDRKTELLLNMLDNIPQDFTNRGWAGIKTSLTKTANSITSKILMRDNRYLS